MWVVATVKPCSLWTREVLSPSSFTGVLIYRRATPLLQVLLWVPTSSNEDQDQLSRLSQYKLTRTGAGSWSLCPQSVLIHVRPTAAVQDKAATSPNRRVIQFLTIRGLFFNAELTKEISEHGTSATEKKVTLQMSYCPRRAVRLDFSQQTNSKIYLQLRDIKLFRPVRRQYFSLKGHKTRKGWVQSTACHSVIKWSGRAHEPSAVRNPVGCRCACFFPHKTSLHLSSCVQRLTWWIQIVSWEWSTNT